jgi:transcriptional regulator with XRE-family HTH domain
MPKTHDVKIWNRIVEAFTLGKKKVKGTPTAIAKELGMAQTSVRQWQIGETTPSRAHILLIAKKTGYLSWYIEDAILPKRAPESGDAEQDAATVELLEAWSQLSVLNRGRLLQSASDLLSKQFPSAEEQSGELHPRPS